MTWSDEKIQELVTVLEKVEARLITRGEAAALCGLSTRSISNKLNRWKEDGIEGLRHRLAGKPSNNSRPEDTRKAILEYYYQYLKGRSPSKAIVILEEQGFEPISRETLRKWLIASEAAAAVNGASSQGEARVPGKAAAAAAGGGHTNGGLPVAAGIARAKPSDVGKGSNRDGESRGSLAATAELPAHSRRVPPTVLSSTREGLPGHP